MKGKSDGICIYLPLFVENTDDAMYRGPSRVALGASRRLWHKSTMPGSHTLATSESRRLNKGSSDTLN